MNDVNGNPSPHADAASPLAQIAGNEHTHPLAAVAAHPKPEQTTTPITSDDHPHHSDVNDDDDASKHSIDDGKALGKPPIGLAWRSSDRFIIATVAIAVFTVSYLIRRKVGVREALGTN